MESRTIIINESRDGQKLYVTPLAENGGGARHFRRGLHPGKIPLPELRGGFTLSLPFCHLTLRAERPLPPSYPDELESIGDHLRKKRLDEDDYQREVARELGLSPDTINNWEQGHTDPALRHIPPIIDYLGYVPFEIGETWGEKIEAYRKITGTPRSELADRLGVDESTVFRWETARSMPSEESRSELKRLIQELDEMTREV